MFGTGKNFSTAASSARINLAAEPGKKISESVLCHMGLRPQGKIPLRKAKYVVGRDGDFC